MSLSLPANTRHSINELLANLLAPCTPVHGNLPNGKKAGNRCGRLQIRGDPSHPVMRGWCHWDRILQRVESVFPAALENRRKTPFGPCLLELVRDPAQDCLILGRACIAAALGSPDRVEQDRAGEALPQDCALKGSTKTAPSPRTASEIKKTGRIIAFQRRGMELNKFEIVDCRTGLP